ncbi:F-box/kelch-repeat protein At3g06240-like [Papaver somniferum]|uniref:F-box/kelch-repeat protein At3g06240-like n=1 Tax=Papaver somniferum TaxID=3469 RepID=UPI000E6FBBDE|nr:F-box/kelch-repeat protein At3g06240-like [Papaver somniferum]
MDNLNNLPSEIISDVLTRLPAQSVLDGKLVSKIWRDLIKHPLFYKMHTNRLINHSATSAYSTDSGEFGFLALAENKKFYYFEYFGNRKRPIRISLTPPIQYYEYTYVGSFNGLICLRGVGENICIYNPMTKEYVFLPHHKIDFNRIDQRWSGFGYLPSTNEYKVVLMYKVPKFVVVMVYTLGSGKGWRTIGEFKLKSDYVFRGNGVFANGALYWMHREKRTILVFDLADEMFRDHLSTPPLPTDSSLGSFGGFLFSAHGCFNQVTKKYMCSELWLYKKKNDNYHAKEQDQHQSFGWTKDLMAAANIPLVLKKSGWVSVFPHKNTFVSLEDLGEEGAQIMQR